METHELLEKLSKKYPSPAYGFITQVRNGTGFQNVTRTADAMAMSLWPSRGIELIGFELKVSRSDWLHELKDPAKAEEMVKFCDRWYLVVSEDNIVQGDELPPTWGLMIATGRGIKVKVEAPTLKPMPLDRLFLASIFRNICDRMIARELIESKLEKSYEDGKNDTDYRTKSIFEKNDKLEKEISIFEKVSGVKINEWGGNDDIGEAVKEVLSGKNKRAKEELVKLKKTSLKITKYIDGEIESYEIK